MRARADSRGCDASPRAGGRGVGVRRWLAGQNWSIIYLGFMMVEENVKAQYYVNCTASLCPPEVFLFLPAEGCVSTGRSSLIRSSTAGQGAEFTETAPLYTEAMYLLLLRGA